MIALLWARVWKYVAALGVLLAAIAAIFLKGRAAGVKTMQPKVDAAKNEAAVATATNQQLESRHETDAEVQRLPDAPAQVVADADPATAAGKLRDDWTRD